MDAEDVAADALGLSPKATPKRRKEQELRMPDVADVRPEASPDYSHQFVWSTEEGDQADASMMGLMSGMMGLGALAAGAVGVVIPVVMVVAAGLFVAWAAMYSASSIMSATARQSSLLRQLREDQRLATRYICRELRRRE